MTAGAQMAWQVGCFQTFESAAGETICYVCSCNGQVTQSKSCWIAPEMLFVVMQEAMDADEHPDMLDFSDAADGLQRTTSNVSSTSDTHHSRHGGMLVHPAPPPPPPSFSLTLPTSHSASSHAELLTEAMHWFWKAFWAQ